MKQQLELDMEQQTGSKLGKEYIKAVYCHPAYLTSMQSTSWETLDWKKHKLESRLLGEISITSDMQMTPPLWQKWRGTKKPLDESERGERKSWLKAQHSENEDHGIRSHHSMGNSWGNSGNSVRLYFGGSKITAEGDCSHEIKKRLLLGRKVMTTLDSIFKSRDITLPTKVRLVKAMVYPCSCMDVRVGLWRRLSAKEWMLLNCGVGEDSWESFGWKESQPVHPKGGQSLVFFGRSDAKAETPILWPPHAKNWLIGKDSDAGRDWGQEEKGTTEDEMAGWPHQLDGREIEWTPGDGDGQGGLCAAIHGVAKSRTRLRDWTELNWKVFCLFFSSFLYMV